jgi:hypothetical protein
MNRRTAANSNGKFEQNQKRFRKKKSMPVPMELAKTRGSSDQ